MREYLYWFLDIVIEQIRGIYVYQLLLLLIVCGIVIYAKSDSDEAEEITVASVNN